MASTHTRIMGAFYCNITLKGPDQKRVAAALRGRRAVVAPKLGDYTVAFDSVCDEQNIDAIQELTSTLSRELHCIALAAIVHDDDVFGYFLYDNGKLIDWYNSAPNYFDFGLKKVAAGPAGGNSETLCAALGFDNVVEVNSILKKPAGKRGYIFETDRHRDLVRVLGLPTHSVGTSLASFDNGECPSGVLAKEIVFAADPPPIETPQQRWDREFYERLGPEDPSRACRHEGCNRGAISNSVMCRRHHFEMIQRRDCPFDQ